MSSAALPTATLLTPLTHTTPTAIAALTTVPATAAATARQRQRQRHTDEPRLDLKSCAVYEWRQHRYGCGYGDAIVNEHANGNGNLSVGGSVAVAVAVACDHDVSANVHQNESESESECESAYAYGHVQTETRGIGNWNGSESVSASGMSEMNLSNILSVTCHVQQFVALQRRRRLDGAAMNRNILRDTHSNTRNNGDTNNNNKNNAIHSNGQPCTLRSEQQQQQVQEEQVHSYGHDSEQQQRADVSASVSMSESAAVSDVEVGVSNHWRVQCSAENRKENVMNQTYRNSDTGSRCEMNGFVGMNFDDESAMSCKSTASNSSGSANANAHAIRSDSNGHVSGTDGVHFVSKKRRPRLNGRRKQNDANTNRQRQTSTHILNSSSSSSSSVLSARWSVERRRVWCARLMHLVWLLPPTLTGNEFAQFLVYCRPEGRRCLLVCHDGKAVSRSQDGQVLHTFCAPFPGGYSRNNNRGKSMTGSSSVRGSTTILDCIFHSDSQTYFLTDVLTWNSVECYECDSEFRAFFLRSRCQELGFVLEDRTISQFRFRLVAIHAATYFPKIYPRDCSLPQNVSADGYVFIHRQSWYVSGVNPLAFRWKDMQSSNYVLDETPHKTHQHKSLQLQKMDRETQQLNSSNPRNNHTMKSEQSELATVSHIGSAATRVSGTVEEYHAILQLIVHAPSTHICQPRSESQCQSHYHSHSVIHSCATRHAQFRNGTDGTHSDDSQVSGSASASEYDCECGWAVSTHTFGSLRTSDDFVLATLNAATLTQMCNTTQLSLRALHGTFVRCAFHDIRTVNDTREQQFQIHNCNDNDKHIRAEACVLNHNSRPDSMPRNIAYQTGATPAAVFASASPSLSPTLSLPWAASASASTAAFPSPSPSSSTSTSTVSHSLSSVRVCYLGRSYELSSIRVVGTVSSWRVHADPLSRILYQFHAKHGAAINAEQIIQQLEMQENFKGYTQPQAMNINPHIQHDKAIATGTAAGLAEGHGYAVEDGSGCAMLSESAQVVGGAGTGSRSANYEQITARKHSLDIDNHVVDHCGDRSCSAADTMIDT